MPEAVDFEVKNGFGLRTNVPFVMIRLGDRFVQVTPQQCRQLGLWMFEAAEAADSDAFLVGWMQSVGFAYEQIAVVLEQFRAMKGDARRVMPSDTSDTLFDGEEQNDGG